MSPDNPKCTLCLEAFAYLSLHAPRTLPAVESSTLTQTTNKLRLCWFYCVPCDCCMWHMCNSLLYIKSISHISFTMNVSPSLNISSVSSSSPVWHEALSDLTRTRAVASKLIAREPSSKHKSEYITFSLRPFNVLSLFLEQNLTPYSG